MAEKVVAPVEEGRFGILAAVGGAFALAICLSEVVLLESVGLGGTALTAAALFKRGLGASFNLEALTAGCDQTAKVNNEWQNKEGNQRYTTMNKV